MSSKRAFEMLFTGEFIDAADRARAGASSIASCRRPSSMPRSRALADIIRRKSPSVVALGKRAFYEQIDAGCQAYALTASVMACNMLGPDAAEGVDAFIVKRQPNWR